MSAFGNLLKEKLKPINDLRTQVATNLSNRKLRARGLFQLNNDWLSYDLPDDKQEVLVFQTGNVYTSQVHAGLLITTYCMYYNQVIAIFTYGLCNKSDQPASVISNEVCCYALRYFGQNTVACFTSATLCGLFIKQNFAYGSV